MRKIKQLEKISLPEEMIPLDVDVGDYGVVVCKEEDNVFLFTCGLSSCTAIAARCQTEAGHTVLGLLHLNGTTLSSSDFPKLHFMSANEIIQLSYHTSKLNEIKINEIIEHFHPYEFNNLIDKVKSYIKPNEVIDIYLGGGMGYFPVVHQLYCEYIKRREDLRLCDTALNPYNITTHEVHHRFSQEVRKTISSTFGITTNGDVILTKRINIDDLSKLANGKDFIEYCEKKKITFPPNDELVFGFETLTWKYLHREDHEYEFNTRTKLISKKMIVKSNNKVYPSQLFSESQFKKYEEKYGMIHRKIF